MAQICAASAGVQAGWARRAALLEPVPAVRYLRSPEAARRLALSGHTEELNAISYSPDGTQILTAAGKHSDDAREMTARLWHAPSRQYRACVIRATPIRNDDGSVREWVGACTEVQAVVGTAQAPSVGRG